MFTYSWQYGWAAIFPLHFFLFHYKYHFEYWELCACFSCLEFLSSFFSFHRPVRPFQSLTRTGSSINERVSEFLFNTVVCISEDMELEATQWCCVTVGACLCIRVRQSVQNIQLDSFEVYWTWYGERLLRELLEQRLCRRTHSRMNWRPWRNRQQRLGQPGGSSNALDPRTMSREPTGHDNSTLNLYSWNRMHLIANLSWSRRRELLRSAAWSVRSLILCKYQISQCQIAIEGFAVTDGMLTFRISQAERFKPIGRS